jgi:hypothetical protein
MLSPFLSRITTDAWRAEERDEGYLSGSRRGYYSFSRTRQLGQDLGQWISPDNPSQADQRPEDYKGFKMRVPGVAVVDLDVQGLRRPRQ